MQKSDQAKAFAQFVSESPQPQLSLANLTGAISKSQNEAMFTLTLDSGQALEVPLEAVEAHTVLDEKTRRVDLRVDLKKIPGALGTVKPNDDKMPMLDSRTSMINLDVNFTVGPADALGTGIADSLAEQTFTAVEQTFTQAEGAFGPDFGRVTIPELGGFNLNAPFLMATPHHAPQAAVMAQNLAANTRAAGLKTIASDGANLTGINLKPLMDTRKSVWVDIHTLKELVHDNLKPVGDPGPGSWVENTFPGNVAQELVNPVVFWNLPGMI